MTEADRVVEPAVARWDEQPAGLDKEDREDKVIVPLFGLSGGLMRTSAMTANRIDGLLTKMMEHSASGRYSKDIDRNLDYLYTYLQLDMINIIADSYGPRDRRGPDAEDFEEVKEELGDPVL